MLRTVGSQTASIHQGAIRIWSLNWSVTCSARKLDRSRGTKAWKGNIWLTWYFEGWFKTFKPEAYEDSTMHSNADINKHLRIPTNPPLVDPYVEMSFKLCKSNETNWNQFKLCEEEDIILEPMSPHSRKPASRLKWGGIYAGMRVALYLLERQYKQQVSLERKKKLYHLDCINRL